MESENQIKSPEPGEATSLYLEINSLISKYGLIAVKKVVSSITEKEIFNPSNMEGDD